MAESEQPTKKRRTSDNKKERWGESVKDYPEAYTKIPAPVKEKKPGQLTQDQINQFFNEGYCVVENYFTPEELQPCRDACMDLTEEVAQKLYKAGKISSLYKDEGVFQRLTAIQKEFKGAPILMFKQGTLPQAFMDIWGCEKLLNMVEQLIGPDISSHPVWNLRIKTPGDKLGIVPWHQDNAYFSEDAYDHLVATAWIPFLDTHEGNGGMQMVKNGHRTGHTARHTCCVGDSWYVNLDEKDMEETLDVNVARDTVTCRVPYGGFLLFSNAIPHRSLPNTSNDIRWSMDLRWQSPFEKWGFYDIAEGVRFRSSTDPDVKPDWKKFLSVNRKKIWQERHCKGDLLVDEFDTTVTGPWIGRWELVQQNRHTDAFKKVMGEQ